MARSLFLGKLEKSFGSSAYAARAFLPCIESCRRGKIDPYTYLRDVLTRLPRRRTTEFPKSPPPPGPRPSRNPPMPNRNWNPSHSISAATTILVAFKREAVFGVTLTFKRLDKRKMLWFDPFSWSIFIGSNGNRNASLPALLKSSTIGAILLSSHSRSS
jgi:hypothetical protein